MSAIEKAVGDPQVEDFDGYASNEDNR